MSDQRNFNIRGNPFSALLGILITVGVFILLFYLTQFIFKLLWIASPFLLVASLVIDHTVFLGYAKWIGRLLKTRFWVGLGAMALSALLFPLTVLYLFSRSLLNKKVREVRKEAEIRRQGEYADFEIVEEKPLDLPGLEKESRTKKGNDYDRLFAQ
ncbi:MAG TPA: hypothetical protein PKE06_05675 [Flavilitoribacter sp.]|nr:hypothetical protein [Flavilitoribacter sp.]